LKTDKRYRDDYTMFMKKALSYGFTEEVSSVQTETGNEENMWYILHHGVYHPMLHGIPQ